MAGYYTTKTTPWLSITRPNPQAALRLFCFPHSGASANVFYPWAESLPAVIEVCPVQFPGRGTRVAEPLFTRLPDLVSAAAAALLPYLDRPFAFFGHSLGALVSFELARYLRREHNLSPLHLIPSGHGAPHLPDPNPPLHQLPEPQFVHKLRELNGMTRDVLENVELMQLLLPIIRADFTICETYTYEPAPPLDCPILVCCGLQDHYVSRPELDAWQAQTTRGCSVRMFPGDHFYLNSARHLLVQVVARELSPYLV